MDPFFLAIAIVTADSAGCGCPGFAAAVGRLAQDRAGEELVLREPPGRPPAVADVAGDFLRAVLDLGDVLEEDGLVVKDADDQIAQFCGVVEGLAGVHADQLVLAAKIPRRLRTLAPWIARRNSKGET